MYVKVKAKYIVVTVYDEFETGVTAFISLVEARAFASKQREARCDDDVTLAQIIDEVSA